MKLTNENYDYYLFKQAEKRLIAQQQARRQAQQTRKDALQIDSSGAAEQNPMTDPAAICVASEIS